MIRLRFIVKLNYLLLFLKKITFFLPSIRKTHKCHVYNLRGVFHDNFYYARDDFNNRWQCNQCVDIMTAYFEKNERTPVIRQIKYTKNKRNYDFKWKTMIWQT